MDNFRKACTEVCQILKFLDITYINSIPKKLINFLNENKDNEYIKEINPEDSLENQNLLQETIDLLALIKLSYWCKDENEKRNFQELIYQNDIRYEETIREKYNPDDIFCKIRCKQEKKLEKENIQLIEYKKQSMWSKILNKIKTFFNIN